MDFLAFAVLGLLGVLVLVFGILSAKSAKFLHITLLFLVFIALSATVMLLSKAARIRFDWSYQYNESKEDFETEKARYQEALYGPSNAIELPRDCLIGIENLLDIELTGMGRVWRTVKPAVTGDNQVTLTFPAGLSNQIANDMQLYCFKEQAVPVEGSEDAVRVPTDYIASVRVTNVNNNVVTATGQFIADSAGFTDAEAMKAVRWTVFEKMPVHPSDALMRAAYGQSFDPAFPPSNVNYDPAGHVAKMRDAFKKVFQKPESMSEVEYESIVDKYAFEGMRIDEINTWMTENGQGRAFDIKPEERFFHLVVKDNKTIQIKVDSTDNSSLKNRPAIDPNTGLAIAENLKSGNKDGIVTLKAKESGYFDSVSCEKGVDGIVKLNAINSNESAADVDAIVYRRAIVDFPSLIQKVRQNTADLDKRIADWQSNIDLAKLSNASLTDQSNAAQKKIKELSDDNSNLKKDREMIESLQSELREEVTNTKQRINDLYADIAKKHELLEKYNQLLLEQEAKNRK